MPTEDTEDLPESVVVRRVALDVGSNATKCLIADVDVASGTIVQTLFGVEVPCSFSVSWKASPDGSLAESVMEQGLRILNGFARKVVYHRQYANLTLYMGFCLELSVHHPAPALNQATALGATQKAAVATEVFRKATNGAAYLARVRTELGLEVRRRMRHKTLNLYF